MSKKKKQRKEDLQFYIDALKSDACQCERTKKEGFALCYSCYKKLGKHLQNGLWMPINKGFEQAYDEAVRFLNED
jgi:hypothetical protein